MATTTYSTIGPPPGNNGETMVMDDTDPVISYFTPAGTSGWEVVQHGVAYNHTLHQTTCNICAATLLFNGTGISMSALVSQQGSDFMAVIDGVFSGPFRLYNDVDQISIVYTVEGLSNTVPHNITFMKMSNDPASQSIFNIDSLTIISRPVLSSASFTTSAVPSGRTTTPHTGAGATPSNSAVPPHAQSTSSPPVGAIVGGVVGGLAVLGVVIAWIILMRRRRTQKAHTVVYYH